MAVNGEAKDAERFYNGLPADAALDDKRPFSVFSLNNNRTQDLHGSSLFECCADDFEAFSPKNVKIIDSDTLRN